MREHDRTLCFLRTLAIELNCNANVPNSGPFFSCNYYLFENDVSPVVYPDSTVHRVRLRDRRKIHTIRYHTTPW